MKHLTFNNVQHLTNGHYKDEARYAIDWQSLDDRRYKVPIRGLKVYEDNSITLHSVGVHDPQWRDHVADTYGLHTTLVSDLAGYTLHDPKDGRKITKKPFTGCYYFDRDRMRLYDLKPWQRGKALYWTSWDAEPEAGTQISYHLPNKAKAAALMERLQPYVDLGTTLNMVPEGNVYQYRGGLQHSIEWFLANWNADLKSETAQKFARIVARYAAVWLPGTVINITRDEFKNDYLTVKEK